MAFSAYGTEGVVFNENSLDQDFRVKSTSNTHALFVDASSGNVSLGNGAPDARLHITEVPANIIGGNAANGCTMKGIKLLTTLNSNCLLYTSDAADE